MTSSPHGPYIPGYTRATMASTEGCETARWSESQKNSSQSGLQSATRLHEGGIASNRESAGRGEYVPGPYTPPVKRWKPEVPEIGILTARKKPPKVKSVTGAKS